MHTNVRYRPFDYQHLTMLIPIVILVLLSALVATDPDTPGGGHQQD
jgi:hypothetical protein